jgi:glutamate synthase (NADPH/NADH) large chain
VVEGCGSNGCEYMTGGTAVILGKVGANFGAGMTGGMAFVYDPDGSFQFRVNPESVIYQRIETEHWERVLKNLVKDHVANTQSALGQRLLADWAREMPHFWQIVPKEMIARLENPVTREPAKKALA